MSSVFCGKNHPRWKGEQLDRICKFCQKKYRTRTEKEKKNYCSTKCYHQARRENITYKIDGNGCHICTSHAGDKDGYPKISRMVDGKSKTYHLSRFLWAQKYGEIPAGMVILHNCDNPACINLDHLSVGTNFDNSSDMIAKLRQAKGEKAARSKLNDCQVTEIKRNLHKSDYELATEFNVVPGTIYHIRKGLTWTHITL